MKKCNSLIFGLMVGAFLSCTASRADYDGDDNAKVVKGEASEAADVTEVSARRDIVILLDKKGKQFCANSESGMPIPCHDKTLGDSSD